MAGFDLVVKKGTLATAANTVRADAGTRDGKAAGSAEDRKGGGDQRERAAHPAERHPATRISPRPPALGLVLADDFESGTRSVAIHR